jgi:TetR/AcrR family transcriptional regulator, mexJK operon transcriptional repressor
VFWNEARPKVEAVIEHDNVKIGRNASRGESRKKELADVAERMFLQHGFSDTTMNMIAKEAHASKETLYRHFLSKEVLFSEIVRRRAARVFDPHELACDEGPPSQILFRLGCRVLRALTRPGSLDLFRVVVAETPRAPELGRLFWSQGPVHVQRSLSAYLTGAHKKGTLVCENAEMAARLFLGAAIATHQTLALVSSPAFEIGDAEIESHVAGAVEMFLSRFGAKT